MAVKNTYKIEEDIKTNIVNSYAWDTTLAWLNKTSGDNTYSSSINHGNYGGTIKPTGGTTQDQVNNICDMAGNVREWTSEIYKGKQTVWTVSISLILTL